MDFSVLIKKSFEIAWHNRVLWLFGFLSGGAGAVGYINPVGYTFNYPASTSGPQASEAEEAERLFSKITQLINSISLETWLLIIAGLAVVVFALLLVGIFISNWATSGLIYCILRRNVQTPTFSLGARAGLKYWWKFWLLALIFGLIIGFLILVFGVSLVVGFLGGLAPVLGGIEIRLTGAIVSLLMFVGYLSFILLIIVSVVGGLIITVAQRMIIHKGVRVLESIRLSGGLVKRYFSEVALTFLLSIGLSFAAGFIAMFAATPIGLVLASLFLAKLWWVASILMVPVWILMATAGGFWVAFQAAYWTLFYEHLVAREGW